MIRSELSNTDDYYHMIVFTNVWDIHGELEAEEDILLAAGYFQECAVCYYSLFRACG